MSKFNERDLLIELKRTKERLDALKDAQTQAQLDYDNAVFSMIEFLESHSAVSTAKYEGIGYAQIQKPRLYASCTQNNLDNLFTFLRDKGRDDLIKTIVQPQSLSSFVKECIENGIEVPECISYYLKPSIKLYE
ncbi:MAG: hypothetical protein RBU23_05070 [Candidatus Auribacterota bacterium]|jgi:hypothetical protein|nr:hypothetical protein [Candidatus Auribacterota bacterium]